MRWMQATAMTAAMLLVACKSKEPENQASVVTDVGVAGSSAMSESKVSGLQGIAGSVQGGRDFASPPSTTPVAVESSNVPAQPSSTQGADPLTVQIAPTMVIRNGQASVEVDKLDPAIVKLRQLAAQLGGYIANSSMSGGKDQIRSAMLELAVVRGQQIE